MPYLFTSYRAYAEFSLTINKSEVKGLIKASEAMNCASVAHAQLAFYTLSVQEKSKYVFLIYRL